MTIQNISKKLRKALKDAQNAGLPIRRGDPDYCALGHFWRSKGQPSTTFADLASIEFGMSVFDVFDFVQGFDGRDTVHDPNEFYRLGVRLAKDFDAK